MCIKRKNSELVELVLLTEDSMTSKLVIWHCTRVIGMHMAGRENQEFPLVAVATLLWHPTSSGITSGPLQKGLTTTLKQNIIQQRTRYVPTTG